MTEDDAAVRRLWASVLIQALIDATSEPKTPQGRLHKKRAEAWITAEFGTTAQNFESVCLAGNIEPSRVRSFIKSYDGPPLTLHIMSRMRDSFLRGDSNEDPTTSGPSDNS